MCYASSSRLHVKLKTVLNPMSYQSHTQTSFISTKNVRLYCKECAISCQCESTINIRTFLFIYLAIQYTSILNFQSTESKLNNSIWIYFLPMVYGTFLYHEASSFLKCLFSWMQRRFPQSPMLPSALVVITSRHAHLLDQADFSVVKKH